MNATYYKSAGAVGCITDGGVRDLLEMCLDVRDILVILGER